MSIFLHGAKPSSHDDDDGFGAHVDENDDKKNGDDSHRLMFTLPISSDFFSPGRVSITPLKQLF